MNVSKTFIADPEVVASEIEGGAALLDLRTSQYYGLNPVGAFVWEKIQNPMTLDQLASAVADVFDVDEARARADITQLLLAFDQAGVIKHHA